MQHDGLVERRQVGRSNCLFLTPRGQRLFDEVVPQQENLIATALAPLDEAEQRELLRLLRKLDQQLAI
jgi:DNA-binding MarR family transcriptional regulator